MVLVKKWPFFHLFSLVNICQENVFFDILERKNTLLAYKNNGFKKSKNWDFSKGVNPWFWSKNGHFSMFFLFGNIGQENLIYNIPEQKNHFLAQKKTKFKKSKNWDFSNWLTHGFSQKMAIFRCLFFRQYRPGKCVWEYSTTQKRLSSPLKKRSSKSPIIEIFPKGLTHGFGQKMAIFPCLFFRQYRPGKFVLQYSRTKKRFSSL